MAPVSGSVALKSPTMVPAGSFSVMINGVAVIESGATFATEDASRGSEP